MTWFISDPHFDHKNFITFTDRDGKLIRPGFNDIDHMNTTIIQNWNSMIGKNDKVYCLGDFGNPDFAAQLNGKKRLILGNHDVKWDKLHKHFEKILLIRWWRETAMDEKHDINFVLSHCPMRFEADSLPHRKVHFNVHGHIHEKLVLHPDRTVDHKYINLCVEHTDYKPVHIDQLVKMMKDRMKLPGYKTPVYME